MHDKSLAMLVFEVRWKTLKMLEGLTHEQAMGVAPGMNNSILYHAGHGYAVQEHLAVAKLEKREPKLIEGFEVFMWNSPPTASTVYPHIDKVKAALIQQRDHLIKLIEGMDASAFDEIVNPEKGRTLRYVVLHGLHDEANHQGEIWLIRKLLGYKFQ
jgi:DinB superfamily